MCTVLLPPGVNPIPVKYIIYYKSILHAIKKDLKKDIPYFCWTKEWWLKETFWNEFIRRSAKYATLHQIKDE
jgi:tyrosyl-tRNA synthetase